MNPAPFRVVLDANVLYPFTLRDTLLRAAAANFFQVYWSEQILDEATRNLVSDAIMEEKQARHGRSRKSSGRWRDSCRNLRGPSANTRARRCSRYLGSDALLAGGAMAVRVDLGGRGVASARHACAQTELLERVVDDAVRDYR
jgi:hypothetical protein